MTWLIPALAAPLAIAVWWAVAANIAERRAQRARVAVLRELRPQRPPQQDQRAS